MPGGICFEPLEPRLLLSGSWGAGIDMPSPDSSAHTEGGFEHEATVPMFRAPVFPMRTPTPSRPGLLSICWLMHLS